MSERRPANDDMLEGYVDGLNLSSPEPSENRSHSYRHGFNNGRVDRGCRPVPFMSIDQMEALANEAMDKDLAR